MPVSIILGLVMEKAWFSQIHLSHSSAAVSDNAVGRRAEDFLAAALAALRISSVVTSQELDVSCYIYFVVVPQLD